MNSFIEETQNQLARDLAGLEAFDVPALTATREKLGAKMESPDGVRWRVDNHSAWIKLTSAYHKTVVQLGKAKLLAWHAEISREILADLGADQKSGGGVVPLTRSPTRDACP